MHERFGTVMPRADGDAETIEDHAKIVGVNVTHEERQHAALLRRLSDEAHAGDGAKALRGVTEQFVLVLSDGIKADALHIIQRRS